MTRTRFLPYPRPIGLSEAEFLALYRARWEDLVRFFARRVLVPEAAADLTAETFARAFIGRATFDPRKGDAAGWLFGIARHQLASYLRTLRIERRACHELGLPHRVLSTDDYDRIEHLIDFREVGLSLRTAMQALAPDQREAVIYRVVDQLTYAQIANRVGCTQETARSRTSRGLRILSTAIASHNLPEGRP